MLVSTMIYELYEFSKLSLGTSTLFKTYNQGIYDLHHFTEQMEATI